MNYYNQNNYPTILAGTNTDLSIGSLARVGCLITAMSTMLQYLGVDIDPVTLNSEMTRKGCFTNGAFYVSNTLDRVVAGIQEENIYGYNQTVINEALAHPRKVVILGVDFSPVAGIQSHYVGLYSAGKIIDPNGGVLRRIDFYGQIFQTKIFTLPAVPEVESNQQNNSMNKSNLIQEIEKTTVFDNDTKSKLINAVTGDDAAYLIAFAGSSPRLEAEQWRRQYEEVNAELEALTVNSQQSTAEKIELSGKDIVELTDTISEANKIIEQGKKEGWSTEEWLMGFVEFGIDKWAMLSTIFASIAQYIAALKPEYTRYIWGYAAVLSVIILIYFLTNKIIDKTKK